LINAGRKIKEGWKKAALKNMINIEISGIDPLAHFEFKDGDPLILKTLFTQLMLEKDFLASNAFYASYAHKDAQIKKYLEAVDEVFSFISSALVGGKPEKFLKGPVCNFGFKRLT
jgi:hypothetical protein